MDDEKLMTLKEILNGLKMDMHEKEQVAEWARKKYEAILALYQMVAKKTE
jgi:hypothetical protein